MVKEIVKGALEHRRRSNIFWQWQFTSRCGTAIDLDSNAWIHPMGARIEFERIKLLLKLALLAFEFGAHILTSADKLDRQSEVGWLVGIRKYARLDVCVS